jgi:murein DD-endopeptidase MepM/ murein hydrolase activator NlpD
METTARDRLIPLTRRHTLTGLGALAGMSAAAPVWAQAETASAKLMQGGFVIGRTKPRAPIGVDGKAEGFAAASGLYILGFDRDAPATTDFGAYVDGRWQTRNAALTPVVYNVQHVDGLPPETVTPTQPEIIARIGIERAKKTVAAASRADTDDFRDGFVLPLDNPIRTSPFGVQRVLNGEPKQPHYGVDLAAPSGTPIHAPAAGLVVLAEPDMFLEGGLTMIDHGQGLISYYLHQSRQHVQAGQRVERRQLIGEVGMKGRATGNHLCWRLTWRGRHMDPSLLIGAAAPA